MLNEQHLKIVHIPHINRSKHIFNWSYFQVLFTVIYSSILILLKKKQKWWSHSKKHAIMDLVWDSFPFYMRTVQSQTGTKITLVGSATDTKSDCSEFVFRPVPCKRMTRTVWRAIRTHTGPISSRSHVFTLPCSAAHDPFAFGWHMKGAVSRQSSSFCLILPITRPQSLWNLK